MEVHRCRFVPYPPSTINAVAFSHSHITKDQKTAPPRLAVGRANGDIELWNPLSGSWLQETIIRGGVDRSVDGLVWIQDPNEQDVNGKTIIGKSRLFSIGYTTTVTEWDLESGRPLRQASGNHGEIWCLAAQPTLTRVQQEANGLGSGQWEGQNLIAGCTDGALVLYSTKDDDLQLQRVLVRPSAKKAKIISVAFQDRNIVVVGCTDSAIRVYDIRNGANIRTMSFGAGPKGGPKEIIVWSVKVLQNGNIVSGDSTGELRIWDGKTYTLMQRVKSHRQDILSLALSFDGSTIVSGGMDRRTVVYKRVDKKKGRWAEVGHRRYHTHDVKTMATLEYKGMSVVVSGGPDASPMVLPLRQFGMESQRQLPFLPQESPIASAPSQRLVMSFWEREIHIWRLVKPSEPTTEVDELQSEKSRKLVAKILIKGEANITSAALSADGNLLAAATATDIKLFRLKSRKLHDGGGLKVSKLSVPASFSIGARHIQLSPDEKWLCIVRPDSKVFAARLLSNSTSTTIHPQLSKLSRIDRQIEKRILLGGLGAYDRTITQIAFSSDSRILAVSDLAGYVDTFILSGLEDLTEADALPADDAASDASDSEESDAEEDGTRLKLILGQCWKRNPSAASLPKLPSAITVLSFRPSTAPQTNGDAVHAITTRHNPNPIPHDLPKGEDRLLATTSTGDIFEFEVLKGLLTPWSRRNPTAHFPSDFRRLRDQPRGCIWDVNGSRERVWLYGMGWLWMFDLSRDFPREEANGRMSSKKRKRGVEKASGAGSSIPDKELGTGISRKMERIIHGEVDETEDVPFKDQDLMDVDSEDDGEDTAMERLPRGDEEEKQIVKSGEEDASGKAHWWRTFKYRPILGMCVIGEQEDDDVGPEVVVVERPIWEADLDPRYFGDQEWEKSDLQRR